MTRLMWFRADLRTTDNPALFEACEDARQEGDGRVIGLFICCPGQWREHDWSDAKVDLILRTLQVLKRDLANLNIPLLIRITPTFEDVPAEMLDACRKSKAAAVHFDAEYEVNEQRRDRAVTELLEPEGIEVSVSHDQTVVRPDVIRTGKDGFYTVFTPFRKAWIKHVEAIGVPEPLTAPSPMGRVKIRSSAIPKSVEGFIRTGNLKALWPAGQHEPQTRLDRFLKERAARYATDRDFPAIDGTSSLSPYLAVGAISARQCLHACYVHNKHKLEGGKKGCSTWISELIWREFYRHVVVGFPRVSMYRPFKLETEAITWSDNEDRFTAWREGRTGVPIVDAAMRQLLETGWMHNRLRMVTAMFLTKDLFIDWRLGERHFMRHLIDGDLASNNGGWQWSASTGTDAAPYFRIFNPYSQSRRFDPDGEFIRRYVPELGELDNKFIHDPSSLPPLLRAGLDYPDPIVDHAEARHRAIDAFKGLRE